MLPTITCRALVLCDPKIEKLRPDIAKLRPGASPAVVNEALATLDHTLRMLVPPTQPAMPTDHPEQRATIRHINRANAKVPANAYLDPFTAEIQVAHPDYRPPLIMSTPACRPPDMATIALACCAYRIFERLTGHPPTGKRGGGTTFIELVFEVCGRKKIDMKHYLPLVRDMLES